jgi:hypothetical protein
MRKKKQHTLRIDALGRASLPNGMPLRNKELDFSMDPSTGDFVILPDEIGYVVRKTPDGGVERTECKADGEFARIVYAHRDGKNEARIEMYAHSTALGAVPRKRQTDELGRPLLDHRPSALAGTMAFDDDDRLVSVSYFSGHHLHEKQHLLQGVEQLLRMGAFFEDVTVDDEGRSGTPFDHALRSAVAALEHDGLQDLPPSAMASYEKAKHVIGKYGLSASARINRDAIVKFYVPAADSPAPTAAKQALLMQLRTLLDAAPDGEGGERNVDDLIKAGGYAKAPIAAKLPVLRKLLKSHREDAGHPGMLGQREVSRDDSAGRTEEMVAAWLALIEARQWKSFRLQDDHLVAGHLAELIGRGGLDEAQKLAAFMVNGYRRMAAEPRNPRDDDGVVTERLAAWLLVLAEIVHSPEDANAGLEHAEEALRLLSDIYRGEDERFASAYLDCLYTHIDSRLALQQHDQASTAADEQNLQKDDSEGRGRAYLTAMRFKANMGKWVEADRFGSKALNEEWPSADG